MNSESQKAQAFIGRLLQNPAMNGFSVLQREEQIIQFLHVNAAQLAPTLSSQAFFPGKSWNQIFSLLIENLYTVINAELFGDLEKIIANRMDFTFIQLIRQQQADSASVGAALLKFVKALVEKPEARRAFTGPYTALHYNFADRYLDEIFARKTYIHFELTKVQRLRLGKEEIRNYIDTNLFLKAAVAIGGNSSQSQQDRATGMVQNQYAEKILGVLKKELKLIPESVLKSAVHASVSFNDNRFVEATSRLTAVLAARGRSYQAGIKVDRGADSPDKSWLSTARRNYKFYGFDIKVLDELYKIAAENVW